MVITIKSHFTSEVRQHVASPYLYQTQLYGLYYSTTFATSGQTADHQVEGNETITSNGIQYSPLDIRKYMFHE